MPINRPYSSSESSTPEKMVLIPSSSLSEKELVSQNNNFASFFKAKFDYDTQRRSGKDMSGVKNPVLADFLAKPKQK